MSKENIQSGLGAVNLYGVTDTQLQSLMDAQQAGLQALEQRYSNPNWFNVAAGFFKPQLGGFAASLGSATQALGENVEKQRESQIPIAKMRSDIALTQMAMGQKQKAIDLTKEAAATPGGITPDHIANVANYDKERAAVLQQQFDNQVKIREQIMAAHAAGRSDAELAAQYGPAFALLFPAGTPAIATVPGSVSKTPAAADAASKSNTPPLELNMTQEQWDNTPLTKRNELMADLASSNKDVELKSQGSYRTAAEQALPRLELYQGMRTLSTRPGMDKVFNILGDSDLVSLGGKALSEGRLTDRLANLEGLLTQANITDPTLRADAAKLVKLINESNALSANTTSSPTDMAASLRNAANPSMNNPRDAFISLTDALAHRERNHLDVFDLMQGKGPDQKKHSAANFISSPEFKANKRRFMEEHQRILTEPPTDVTPDWYMPAKQAPAPAKAAATAATSKPTTSGPTLDAIKAEIAKRAAAKGTP